MAHKKTNLPSRRCAHCQRPFTWRKKWRDCWDTVKYCSERCRRSRTPTAPSPPTQSDTDHA